MNIFINKKIWNNFSPDEMNDYQLQVFNYYKMNGFPYFPVNDNWRKIEFQKFINYNDSNIIVNDEIKQTMHGLAYCWSFMPHAFNVSCNGLKTPLQAFNDDNILKEVIKKRIKFGDNISDNGIRKMIKIFTGVQGVSNFRPTAASALYHKFAQNKIVWDMSCGYGGRLIGAYKAKVKKYIGTDPCTETFNGLNNIIKNIQDMNIYNNTIFELYKCGSEDFIPEKNSIDFCFTSPPYFNTEKYSNEETQSWKKFNNNESWLNDFIGKTLENCYYGLKDDGILAINIANVKSYKNLENDFLNLANQKKFNYLYTIKYSLSNLSHIKSNKYKYEPIFIFNKLI